MEPADLCLVVYYDDACGLCRRVAVWLTAQEQLVPITCVPAQHAAGGGCPIRLEALLAQVTVIASDGAIYRGTKAWIVCLWALRAYRAWSLRMATPRWRPLAERLFASIAGVASWTKRRRGSSARPASVSVSGNG